MAKEGDAAPDFELPAINETFRLSNFLGRRIVIFFYPKDETPGCIAENCLIRDTLPNFERHGALVVGISRDSLESHKRFAEKHRLSHILLSDVDGEVSRSYDALDFLGMSKRMTFIIDEHGKIRKIIKDRRPEMHVREALSFLE
ncbi:MAG: peroxiredoxin, partial [Nitrososphaerota archaeon]